MTKAGGLNLVASSDPVKRQQRIWYHPFIARDRVKLVAFHVVLLGLLLFGVSAFGDPLSALLTGIVKDCWQRSAAAPCFSFYPDTVTFLIMTFIVVIGFALGAFAVTALFWLGFLVLFSTLLFSGLYYGTATDASAPWPFMIFGFSAAALYTYRARNHYEILSTAKLRASFRNQLPHAHLQKLLRHPHLFNRRPTNRLVTLIHIAYSDFANTAETMSPHEAFEELQRLTMNITEVVHRHGGSIASRDGNSTMAFFGYTFDGKENDDFKVDAALNCSIEILRQSLKDSLDAVGRHRIFCPLRITMNTTAASFGDVGDTDAWDLILMGPGVTLTRHLEESCDEFRILMSATARDMIRSFDASKLTISRRFLQIKYHRELIEAYDVDPFLNDAEEISKVLGAYREMVSIQRKEPRWPVPSDTPIGFSSDFGSGSVINFSLSGIGVKMGVYLARGVDLAIHLESEDGKLQESLAKRGLQSIPAEVRWAKLSGETFIHGLRLKNMTADQRVSLMNALREHVRGSESPVEF